MASSYTYPPPPIRDDVVPGHRAEPAWSMWLTDLTSHLNAGFPGISTYANNAAAIAGGLKAGQVYAVTGTNPRQLAVVY